MTTHPVDSNGQAYIKWLVAFESDRHFQSVYDIGFSIEDKKDFTENALPIGWHIDDDIEVHSLMGIFPKWAAPLLIFACYTDEEPPLSGWIAARDPEYATFEDKKPKRRCIES